LHCIGRALRIAHVAIDGPVQARRPGGSIAASARAQQCERIRRVGVLKCTLSRVSLPRYPLLPLSPIDGTIHLRKRCMENGAIRVSMMLSEDTSVPRSVVFSDADRCAEAIVDRVGHDLRLAVPVSIGKPHRRRTVSPG